MRLATNHPLDMHWAPPDTPVFVWGPVLELTLVARRQVIATHPDLEDNNGTSPVKITWDHPLWSGP